MTTFNVTLFIPSSRFRSQFEILTLMVTKHDPVKQTNGRTSDNKQPNAFFSAEIILDYI